jgi:hypothetical protein
MSLGYSIQVTHDGASGRVAKLAGAMTPQRLAAATGPAVQNLFTGHLRRKGKNKRGWPSTGFWAGAARSTSWATVPEGALVSVNQVGVRQRYFGGTIKPVNAKALTIPISPVAYGHTAKDFPGSFVLQTKRGAYIVQASSPTQKETKSESRKRMRGLGGNASKRLAAGLNFLFKLSAGVEQAADPDVLPEKDEIGGVVKKAILAAGRGAK